MNPRTPHVTGLGAALTVAFWVALQNSSVIAAGAGVESGPAELIPCDLSAVVNRCHSRAPFYPGEEADFGWLKPGKLSVPFPDANGKERPVPFDILAPARNHGRSVIVTGGQRNDFPPKFRIPIFQQRVRRVYVLGLVAGWGSVPRGTVLGEIRLRFSDGGELRTPLRAGLEVDDWVHHTATRAVLAASEKPDGSGSHVDALAIDVSEQHWSGSLTWMELTDHDPAVSLTLFAVTVEASSGPGDDTARALVIRTELGKEVADLAVRIRKEMPILRKNGFDSECARLEGALSKLRAALASPGGKNSESLITSYLELERLVTASAVLLRKRRFTRVPDPTTSTFPAPADYMIVLNRFPLYAERGWHDGYRNDPGLGWFGQGGNAENSLRTLGNFIFAYSVLATDPLYDPTVSGISHRQVLARVLAALRYMTRTHVTGDLPCNNGKPWGNHWQSAWWTAKMAAGAWLLEKRGLLPDDLQTDVRRVLVHEADRQLGRKPVSGVSRDTKSEENAWDAEVLAWAAGVLPNHPHATAWEAKTREFCMNTLSVAADRTDATLVDGRPVRDQVFTENLHPDFTIENHGAYHFCYMACPLHSLTWVWYAYAATGRRPPQAVFHHFRDVWNVIRATALPHNGRFVYLSGKDWARYVYGLYFIMPPLVLLGNEFGDRDARLLEARRLQTFEWEQRHNGDGSFFGDRFTHNIMRGWPSEYETDAACLLALCRRLHRAHPLIAPTDPTIIEERLRTVVNSPDCEWTFARSPRAFIGFSWRELHGHHPLGHFIPAGASDLAAWTPRNLLGSFRVASRSLKRCSTRHHERVGATAFTTTGIVACGVRNGRAAVRQFISFTALPDLGVAVLFDRCIAGDAITLERQSALDFQFPNDIFNWEQRSLTTADGTGALKATDSLTGPHRLRGTWLNVDSRLGIVCVGSDRIAVRQPGTRNAPFGSLRVDRLSWAEDSTPRRLGAGEEFRRLAFILTADGPIGTRNMTATARFLSTSLPDCLSLVFTPAGKSPRIVTANFSEQPQTPRIRVPRELRNRFCTTAKSRQTGEFRPRLAPLETVVFCAR